MNIEEKIKEQFIKKIGINDIIVSIPDDIEESLSCEVMEKKDNGKVWEVELTKNYNIKSIYDLDN